MQTTTLESAQYNGEQLPPKTPPADYTVMMPTLWDQKILADYLKKSEAWCERARWAGDGPKFLKLGRHVRYRATDVLEWLEENARTCSSMEG